MLVLILWYAGKAISKCQQNFILTCLSVGLVIKVYVIAL